MTPLKIEADIFTIDERHVTFRASIDESEPETIIIKITRERWNRYWDRTTKIPIELFPYTEKPGQFDV